MDDDWETFPGGRASTGECRITIWRSGVLGFNHAAYLALGAPERIAFRYTTNQRAIGLRAARPGDRFTVRVRKQLKGRSYVAAGKAILAQVGYPLGTARVCIAPLQDDMLVVDLAGTGGE